VDNGSEQLRELYVGSAARLVGVLAVASGDVREAEDVVQEAFVRLLTRWPVVRHYDDPEAWVRSVAFRLLSNRRRKAGNSARALLRLDRLQAATAPTGDRLDVVAALALLPLVQRQVVVLHHLVDLSVEQVAAELHIPIGTVKSRLSRARAALAAHLEDRAAPLGMSDDV
jgi:RNA polymerase sigma-70 factor (ECF subfamily)